MAATTLNKAVERALLKRLSTEQAFKQAYYDMEIRLPELFRRGAFQREIHRVAGLKFIPKNVPLINKMMTELGYKQIIITGCQYFRKIHT